MKISKIPETLAGKWISWIVAAISLFTLLGKFIWGTKTSDALITAVSVSIILLVLTGLTIFRELNTLRKEKYVSISPYLHRALHLIRDLESYLDMLNPDDYGNSKEKSMKQIQTVLCKILDEVVKIFSLLTGTPCRAAIKTIYRHEGKLYIFTFARDSDSQVANRDEDKIRLRENRDSLEENEDLDLLYQKFGPKNRRFFCNDLTKRRNYRTSSYKTYGNPTTELTPGPVNSIFDQKEWPLPYKSTIVWPIQQKESGDILDLELQACIAFVGVDSPSRNVFVEKWDAHLGAAISDALYHPLKRISALF